MNESTKQLDKRPHVNPHPRRRKRPGLGLLRGRVAEDLPAVLVPLHAVDGVAAEVVAAAEGHGLALASGGRAVDAAHLQAVGEP